MQRAAVRGADLQEAKKYDSRCNCSQILPKPFYSPATLRGALRFALLQRTRRCSRSAQMLGVRESASAHCAKPTPTRVFSLRMQRLRRPREAVLVLLDSDGAATALTVCLLLSCRRSRAIRGIALAAVLVMVYCCSYGNLCERLVDTGCRRLRRVNKVWWLLRECGRLRLRSRKVE